MPKDYHVFISSKMVELQEEREMLHKLLPQLGNDLINLRAWVFEDDAPASNQTIREVYLDALRSSVLYIGLFWNQYGAWTIDEFDRATEWGIDRHIYVKNVDADQRDPQLEAFLESQSGVVSGITPKWYTDLDDLRNKISTSIEVWLRDQMQQRPGDSAATFAEFSDDIPDLPKKLIGRDDLMQECRALLEEGADICLQGFGGMGKTAVAATIAARWLDDDMGNILWLKTGSEDADTIMEALAAPFDAQQDIAAVDGRNKLKALRQIVADNNVTLIVLDDVWDGTALREVLRAFPRAMAVIVTSRQRYALDEIIEVGRLSPERALDLLRYFSRQTYDNPAQAKELCHQLGYHAFALEIAGKTLKVDQIQPEALLKRIATTPHDITMPEDFAEEGRSSITELMDASIYALDNPTRHTFLAFGELFAPETTIELLSKVTGQDNDTSRENLTTLQRRGLVERMTVADSDLVFYRVHSLAYSYARTITERHGRSPANNITSIAEFVEENASRTEVLHIVRGNWMSAAQHALELRDTVPLIKIIHPLVHDYLSSYGHTLPFIELVEGAAMAAYTLGDEYDTTRIELFGKLGNIYHQRGNLDNALASYQAALELAEKIEDMPLRIRVLGIMGVVLIDKGDSSAKQLLDEAYELATNLNDDYWQGYVLETLGYYAQSQGDFEATRTYAMQQIDIADRINDVETKVFALLNLGTAENRLGKYQSAIHHHQQMLDLAKRHKNDIWIAHAMQGIGEDYHGLGDRNKAQKYLLDAQQLFEQCGIQTHVIEIQEFLSTEDYMED